MRTITIMITNTMGMITPTPHRPIRSPLRQWSCPPLRAARHRCPASRRAHRRLKMLLHNGSPPQIMRLTHRRRFCPLGVMTSTIVGKKITLVPTLSDTTPMDITAITRWITARMIVPLDIAHAHHTDRILTIGSSVLSMSAQHATTASRPSITITMAARVNTVCLTMDIEARGAMSAGYDGVSRPEPLMVSSGTLICTTERVNRFVLHFERFAILVLSGETEFGSAGT